MRAHQKMWVSDGEGLRTEDTCSLPMFPRIAAPPQSGLDFVPLLNGQGFGLLAVEATAAEPGQADTGMLCDLVGRLASSALAGLIQIEHQRHGAV